MLLEFKTRKGETALIDPAEVVAMIASTMPDGEHNIIVKFRGDRGGCSLEYHEEYFEMVKAAQAESAAPAVEVLPVHTVRTD